MVKLLALPHFSLLALLLSSDAISASTATSDACDRFGWSPCSSASDCTASMCRDLAHGQSSGNPTLAAKCQYNNYTCAVPAGIPGCTAKRCVPVPSSSFYCDTDEHCETVTGQGDVCVANTCVSCGAQAGGTKGWANGGCNFTVKDDTWHRCEYSQHLLPGYECPTGGRAPSGQADFYGPVGGLLGFAAGCKAADVHAAGNCEYGRAAFASKDVSQIQAHGTHPAAACTAASCLMKQRAVPGGPGPFGGEGPQNPCGWDCRDGSLKGVQCAYDQPCLMITHDQTEVTLSVPHNQLTDGRRVGAGLDVDPKAQHGQNTFALTDDVKAALFRPT